MTTASAPTPVAVRRLGEDRHRPVWEEQPTRIGLANKATALTIVVAIILVPIWSVVLTSLSTQDAINRAGGLVMIPDGLTLEPYRQIFGNRLIVHSLLVSAGITTIGTLISMAASILCAYGLSRRGSFGHRTILMLLIITMFFNGGIVPTFLVVSALGGYDQYWSLVLPSAISVFNILVLRGFFAGTAQELIDAARVDGAGHWRTLWSVVMPTSRAVIAVITLFYAVGYWGNFFNALLYLGSNDKAPLQLIIYSYTLQGNTMPGTGVTNTGQYAGHQVIAPLALQMAVVVLTLLPIVVAAPFMQRHFTKGMLLGAVKG